MVYCHETGINSWVLYIYTYVCVSKHGVGSSGKGILTILLVPMSVWGEISLPELSYAASSRGGGEQLHTESSFFLTRSWFIMEGSLFCHIHMYHSVQLWHHLQLQMSPCHADAFSVEVAACGSVNWVCCSVGQYIQGKPKPNVGSTSAELIKMKFLLLSLHRCQQIEISKAEALTWLPLK